MKTKSIPYLKLLISLVVFGLIILAFYFGTNYHKQSNISINNKESVTVFSPREGDKWCLGEHIMIKWQSPKSADAVVLTLHTPTTVSQIAEIKADAGQYDWEAGTILNVLTNKIIYREASTVYTIWVESRDGAILPGKSGMFTLESCG